MTEDNNIRRCTFTRVKASPTEDGLLTFIGSTPTVDRAGDSIKPNWDLTSYKRNPVFLFQHDHGGLPVGRAEKVWQDGDALKFSIRFVPGDIYPFAETVRRMYQEGFLSAVSVGFRALKTAMRQGPNNSIEGFDIEASELLELSAVTIPCNPDALLEGKNVRPVFRDDKSFRENLATWKANGDPAKIKAWLALQEKDAPLDEPAKAPEDTTPLDDVEAALAKGDAPAQLSDLADMLDEASDACEAGEMDACQAAIDAAKATVTALLGEGKAIDSTTAEAKDAPAATEVPAKSAASESTPEVVAVSKGASILDSEESFDAFIRKQLGV